MVKSKFLSKISLIFLLLLNVLLLSGCGSQTGTIIERAQKPKVNAENISLKLAVPSDEAELVDQLVKNFDAVHEEYTIQYEIEGIDLGDSIAYLNENVDTVDIVYIPSGGIPALVEDGKLLMFTENDFTKLSVDLPETAISAVSVDGSVYAVPYSPNSFFMFYNKDFYSESEVKSLDTMMAKDFGPGKYNFCSCLSDSWYLEMFFLGNGCTLYGEDGRDATDCTFNNPNGVEAANYAINLAANQKYIDTEAGNDEFLAGNVGAFTNGAWAAPGFREALGDKLGAAPLPVANIGGNEAQLSNFIDFKTIAVNKNTSQPVAAQKLAVYLANKDSSLRRYQKLGDIPVLQNLANNELIKNDYTASALNEQANYSTNQPNIPQMDKYWGPMADLGAKILEGSVDATTIQAELDNLVIQIVSDGTEPEVELEESEEAEESEAADDEATEEDTESEKSEGSDEEADSKESEDSEKEIEDEAVVEE